MVDVDAAQATRSLRGPVLWGFAVGVIQAASPLGFAWLEPATVYALGLGVIAAVYVGFAVGDDGGSQALPCVPAARPSN